MGFSMVFQFDVSFPAMFFESQVLSPLTLLIVTHNPSRCTRVPRARCSPPGPVQAEGAGTMEVKAEEIHGFVVWYMQCVYCFLSISLAKKTSGLNRNVGKSELNPFCTSTAWLFHTKQVTWSESMNSLWIERAQVCQDVHIDQTLRKNTG